MAVEDLSPIIERLKAGSRDEADIQAIAAAIVAGKLILANAPGSVGIGGDVSGSQIVTGHGNVTGDRNIVIYGADAQTIQSILNQHLRLEQSTSGKSVDELVQEVRSRLYDDIQRLHGTMPLWGVDHWVPLGELFVDVNILEELSSSHRAELDDLWQDFSKNPSYRSLDRIGLGRERERVSGLEVLEKNTNLMVVGKPGSGKTTYLQRIVTECNAGNLQVHKVPVLIKLREFVEDGRSLSYSLERYLEQCWQLSAAETQLVLKQGRSLVLLDGLDEVTGADGQAITKQIKRFARDYPQVQVLVTCRTQSQESRFDRFDYVEVEDFNEPQVRAFAEHWFQTVCGDLTVGKAKATAFLNQLFHEENKAIQELTITPILLSLTCAVFQQTGKFYSKRSKLYEEGLELLLEQWDKSREIERDEIYRDLSVERKLELLSYLAVKKFEQEQYVLFEQAEIEGYIAEFLGIGLRESRGVLRAIEAQHGLLIERSQKVWSFSHLTFQDYLVAKEFCTLEDLQSLMKYITVKHWREVFLLVSGMISSADLLLQLMKQKIDLVMASDQKLQKVLEWVNQKANLIRVNSKVYINPRFSEKIEDVKYVNGYYFLDNLNAYNLTALRAFYLDIIIAYNIEHDTNCQRTCKRALARSLDINFNYDLDNNFNLTVSVDRELVRTLKRLLSGLSPIQNKWLIEQHLYTYHDLQPELEDLLKTLNSQLSEQSEEVSSQWWNLMGKHWIGQLRSLMIKYRTIGHDWQFSDVQKEKIQRYYDANKLLVDCLGIQESDSLPVIFPRYEGANKHTLNRVTARFINYHEVRLEYLKHKLDSRCKVSDDVRVEIAESLLLPITEIEKRKREKHKL